MDLRLAYDGLGRTTEGLEALQLYQLGHFSQARKRFADLALAADSRELAAFYLVLIDRALSGGEGGGWTLNLPAGAPELWETDWLRLIFAGAVTAEVVDDRTGVAADRSIIVDFALTAEKGLYYRRNFEHGIRQVLVHLSDEFYADDCVAYRWCERVYRNYWSPILADLGFVSFLPLGYKRGFARPGQPPRPVADRPHAWSFVGDPAKPTRGLMRRHMRNVPNGFEHLISGWNSADSLSTADYRAVLDRSVFVPCPAGGANLDSYRVCEALEAGCIPIVMRRPGYAYFDRLMPGHPMPVVADWAEAPGLVGALMEAGRCEALAQACHAWWTGHKAALVSRAAADLMPARTAGALTPGPAARR